MESTAGIGPSIHITGSISAQEPLTIAGCVRGNINVPGHALTMTSSADVNGDVTADRITISGKAQGTLRATSRIAVDDTATVEGSLETPVISVAAGAALRADCVIEGRRPTALPLAS